MENQKGTLPALSEEHNRDYFVKNKEGVGTLLVESNYRVMHRPYFAMKGYTHDVMTVNPHTKIAVDAGPIAEQPMTPQEFLALFCL